MPYTKEIYEQAKEIIDSRRKSAEDKNLKIIEEFDALEPQYRRFKNEMINSVKDVIKAIEMEPQRAKEFLQQQKIRNLTAQQNVKSLLKDRGLPDDYLEVKYTCPVCEDTGFFEGKLCECHIKVLKDLAFEEAGKKSPLKFCRFEDFKLHYYENIPHAKGELSALDKMTDIFNACRHYAAEFDTASPSLLMQGETGLGKTHLSLAIAGEVIKKGYSVIYNSAQNIFNELQKERFGKYEAAGVFEAMLLECDLLVIDDLGAEFITQFTSAALYNIINTRINTGLPTIISTNLSFPEIESKYTKRISSRLIGEYSILMFDGYDIRQKKSEDI